MEAPVFSADDLGRWSRGTWRSMPSERIEGVSNDTRTLRPGNIYIALKGENHDGHDYVRQALEKGASAAMVQQDSRSGPESSLPLLRVKDTLESLHLVANGYRRQVGAEVIGITGSVGKSTVTQMSSAMLESNFIVARTSGNWNNEVGLPMSILSMRRDTQIGVFEMGVSHPGDMKPLCRLLVPEYGVITNIGPVHLEFFGSVKAIAEEKSELIRCLSSEGTVVLWRDDECFEMLQGCSPCRVITVSGSRQADYTYTPMQAPGRGTVTETSSGEKIEVHLSFPGEHHLINAAFAAAIARSHGIESARISASLAEYKPLPMRWSQEEVDGIVFINDAYNANPVSMVAAIKTFAGATATGGKLLVLGDMLELGQSEEAEHRKIGSLIASNDQWKGLIAVGRRAAWIADEAENAGLSRNRIARCPDAKSAVQAVSDLASKGDTIFLKASRGMKLEEVKEQYVLLSL